MTNMAEKLPCMVECSATSRAARTRIKAIWHMLIDDQQMNPATPEMLTSQLKTVPPVEETFMNANSPNAEVKATLI